MMKTDGVGLLISHCYPRGKHHRSEAIVLSQSSAAYFHKISDLGWARNVEEMLVFALVMPPSHLFKDVQNMLEPFGGLARTFSLDG